MQACERLSSQKIILLLNEKKEGERKVQKKTLTVALLVVLMMVGTVLPRMPIGNSASLTDINNAIQKGLAYLNSTQASDGSWSASLYPVASTAMAVLAFENNGHYGWNASDPYNNTVQNGLNYLFSQGTNITMTVKPAGNPDVSGTGIGIAFADFSGYTTYETPMVLMAIIASNAPTNVTGPGTPIGERTYYAIAQDTVDFLAWGQNNPGTGYQGEGGWGYTANYGFWSDNSNTPWPILGFMAAELWGIKAPSWVQTELSIWVATCEDLTGTPSSNWYYGSFAYCPGYYGLDHSPYGYNATIAEAAGGILELTYLGAPPTNASIIALEGYINRMWNQYGGPNDYNANFGNLYCMYSVMKAMRETTPTIKNIANYDGTPGVEWYNGTGEYADALVGNQSADGSWVNWVPWRESDAYSTALTTALAVLILQGGMTAPVVVYYSLTVTVLDQLTSNPIVGANVSIVGPQTLSNTTEAGGQAEFEKILAGTYNVTASMTGYQSASVTVSVTNNTDVTIRLTPLIPPPRELKKDAITELEAAELLTTDKQTEREIDCAIEEINESLAPCLWVNDSYLNPKLGCRVFYDEENAVCQLMEILRPSISCNDGTDYDGNTALKNTTLAVIGKLLEADQLLTNTTITDAEALNSTDCRVIHEIKEAQEEFSEALQDINQTHYDEAVDDFRQAWMHAEHAIYKEFGDINCEGHVDLRDLEIVNRALNSCPGQQNWNPAADLYGSGQVTIADLALVAKCFGNTYDS
jgi:hypothetical protein